MKDNTEIWLPIVGFEGKYEVSNQGRVRSLNYHREGRIQVLKPAMSKKGYLRVMLCKDGKAKRHSVHRLVAQTFLPNPLELPEVNHRDENKQNNAVTNLEWCTTKENSNHGTRNARMAAALTNGKCSKPVQQLSLDGVLVAIWPSIMEAWRQTGIYQQNICSCCNGHPKHRTAGGYKWQYA